MNSDVLIIEDNEQNMYMMGFLLERNGFSVAKAFNGKEGLGLAAGKPFDLILLDIHLPCMDGYEVAANLRRIEPSKSTPIVAVTSYAMPGDRDKILAAGCNGYIEKPINIDTFVNEVSCFIKPDVSKEGAGI